MANKNEGTVTAAMVVIGDEILSGRTKDKNIGYVAEFLTAMGIELEEVRVVSDDQDRIVEAVNALRARYTYVFTSGGIGPTHDDITADSVSAAFGVPCHENPEAVAILEEHYRTSDLPFTDARRRMTRTPVGASLIRNAVSKAPGFRMENVHVMAGVPSIMQAMMDAIAPTLEGGIPMQSRTVECPLGEGTIGAPLGELQKKHPDTMMGSYPRYNDGTFSTHLVVRSRDEGALDAAISDVQAMVDRLIAED
ncbi:competence/damage-inducible protein A [Ahrensia sp. R2A130]|uniref:competence/damage-inducible protein A n=1 Tax=Ahrensia sp. R2A130 TaxID=744979 RepID=UPI0001E09BFE|nr:competence/damage-inducible protein A [Ahrensia sp. R2A130]EFL90029.1 molybdopterin binding domain-containing protein [Ahrensia sp. R2A130]